MKNNMIDRTDINTILWFNGRPFYWEKETQKNIQKGKNPYRRKYGEIVVCSQCKKDFFITDYRLKNNKNKDCRFCHSCRKKIMGGILSFMLATPKQEE